MDAAVFGGNTIFSWKIPRTFDGDILSIVDWIANRRIEAIFVKIADGVVPFFCQDSLGNSHKNVTPELVTSLQTVGVKVIGWQFNYGDNPTQEGLIAAQECLKLGLDGMIFDIENQFDERPDSPERMNSLVSTFKSKAPDYPTAFCWWARYKNPYTGSPWHPLQVGKMAMSLCDVGMPMTYWEGETVNDAVTYLTQSVSQWRELTQKPIVVIGRAWTGDGGTVRADAMEAFAKEAYQRCEVYGVSWWAMDWAVQPSYDYVADTLYEINTGEWEEPEPDSVVKEFCSSTNLNVRLTPQITSNIRGGLRPNDAVEIVGPEIVDGEIVWIPVKFYVAKSKGGVPYGTVRNKL